MCASTSRGCHRVVAEVEGVPLWYESEEAELSPAPEAFGTALLLPALHRRRRLSLDAPVCATWLSNVGRLLEVWRGWWGYPKLLPRAATRINTDATRAEGDAATQTEADASACVETGAATRVETGTTATPRETAPCSGEAAPRSRETALCFSGGGDSFHSLLHGEHRPGLLVAVQGFDIPLRDRARMDAFKESLRAVA